MSMRSRCARAARETMLVQRRARAWIDLNRAEHERDPRDRRRRRADRRSRSIGQAAQRAGAGAAPRCGARAISGGGGSTATRSSRGSRRSPALSRRAGRRAGAPRGARFGVAVLLDLHSMPPLGRTQRARIVLGDRFGRVGGGAFRPPARGGGARRAGIARALNAPYAGGHILDRHGEPAARHPRDPDRIRPRALSRSGARCARRRAGRDRARCCGAMIDALADEALPAPRSRSPRE